MRCIFFTKMVREQPVPRLVETLRRMGADGADLCVRPGYPVEPAGARGTLPEAVRQIRAAGLEVPMVTAPTDMTDPAAPAVEELFAACHDAGVPEVKLGYWPFRPGGYWKQVDAARRAIEGFERAATRWGIRACLHTHSGDYLGVNAAAVMHLARGFNPSHVGVYLDPGHLAINGEPLPMAFAMAAEHLALVAVKDALWERGEDGRPRRARFVPVGQGFVDWREMARVLIARPYDGPLSFHSEYESLSPADLIEQTRRDIAFIRRIEAEARSRPA